MDSDDIMLPNRLKLQFEFMEQNPEIGAIGSLVKYVGEAENKGFIEFVEMTNQVKTSEEISTKRFVELQIINPTLFFRKQIAETHGYYIEGDFPEDYELFLRWLSKDVKFAKISEVLLDWYDSKTRLTRTDLRYSTESFYKIKSKYLVEFLQKHNPFYPEIVIWGAGQKSVKRAKILENFGLKIKFYIDVDRKKTESNKNILHYTDIPNSGKIFILSYVANRGARKLIEDFLVEKGYNEGNDFILVS